MSATETVNQTANASADAGAPNASSEATAPAERKYEGHRVYVGNLSFKATEEQVRELANKAEGEVIEVTLPLKFKRPSGYAFIAFKTEEQAQNAIEKLKEEEIDGRPVRLQLARSPDEQNERRAALEEKRKADKDARAAKKAEEKAEAKDAEVVGEGEAAAVKPKKKRTSKKAPRRRVPGQDDEEAEGDATENPDASDVTAVGVASEKTAKPKRKNNKSRKAREARIDGATEGEDAAAAPAEAKPKKEKKPRQPRQQPTGEPSANTVFVANLPFDVDDEGLASIFTNLSIRVKSAKVVVGVRRNRDGKTFRASRGFGFVEVEDPAQQKEAVEKVEGSLIADRKLSAKIANEMQAVEQEEVAEAVKEEKADAPAASA